MAIQANGASLHHATADFYAEAYKKAKEEIVSGVDQTHIFGYVAEPKVILSRFKTAQKIHDHNLETRGPLGTTYRVHPVPYDQKLKKKKKYKKMPKPEVDIRNRTDLANIEKEAKQHSRIASEFDKFKEQVGDQLCRGKDLRDPMVTAKHKCFYAHSNSDWLKLGPIKVEINSYDPFHATIRNLLFDHECDQMTQFLAPQLDFPPGRMVSRSLKNDWTMKNCWPTEDDDKNFEKLNRRIEHLTKLSADASKLFSEPFMCGNYGIGGHYHTHPDYHVPNEKFYRVDMNETMDKTTYSGNRVATIMTIFHSPEAGGATVWPYAKFGVFPEKGSAAFWHNLYASDDPDLFTRHKACPVLIGQKWIGNKWVGYNAQWNKEKCGLHQSDRFKPIELLPMMPSKDTH